MNNQTLTGYADKIRKHRFSHYTMLSLSYVFLGCCMLFSIHNTLLGIDFVDTFYFASEFLYSDNISVFRPLTQLTYQISSMIFGDYIYIYRIINWLILLTSYVSVFSIISFDFFKETKFVFLLSFAIVIGNFSLDGTGLLNGTSYSVLFMTLTLISVYKILIKKGSAFRNWLSITIYITLAILSRFPNIVIIPILLILLTFVLKDNYRTALLASCVLSIILYVLIGSILFGGVKEFIIQLKSSFITSTTSEGSNHGIMTLLNSYFHTLKDIVSNIKYLSVIFVIPFLSFLFQNTYKTYVSVFILIFISSIIAFVYKRIDFSDSYNILCLFFAAEFLLVFILFAIHLIKREMGMVSFDILIVMSSCATVAGSDTGLLFIGQLLFAFLPYIIYSIKKDVFIIKNSEIMIVVFSLVSLSVISFIYCRENIILAFVLFVMLVLVIWISSQNNLNAYFKEETHPYLWNINVYIGVIICAMFCMSIWAIVTLQFQDLPHKELTCAPIQNKLKYLRTSPQNCEYINQVLCEYDNYKEENVYFFGSHSAIFSYLTKTGIIDGIDYSQEDNIQNRMCLNNLISDSHPIIFICPYFPSFPGWGKLSNYRQTHDNLIEKGYRCIDKTTYAIYEPRLN